jgi:hypothetical protein
VDGGISESYPRRRREGDESALSCLTINISQKTAKNSTRIIYKNYFGFSSSGEEFLMLFCHHRLVVLESDEGEFLKAPERREEIIKAEGRPLAQRRGEFSARMLSER